MRPRIALAAVLGAGLIASLVTALPAPRDAEPGANGQVQLVASTNGNPNAGDAGRPLVTNSLDGKPILTVADLQPGRSRSGQVTVKNAGSAPQTVGVWQSNLTAGPADRPNLAAWAQLTVHDGALNKTLYAAPYKDFPAMQQPLLVCGVPKNKESCPAWAKGESHVFTFTVTFPDVPAGSGADINTYQSTWLRSEFDWASVI
jgi:hypothetical protein